MRGVLAAALALIAHLTPAATPKASYEPLPIELIASIRSYRHYDLSPDGRFVVYSYVDSDGDAHRTNLLDLISGQDAAFGAPGANSWMPVWSPDGQQAAYYSDAGGAAKLWVWERQAGQARQIAEAEVPPLRPSVTGSTSVSMPAVWLADSARLVLKLEPQTESQSRDAPDHAREAAQRSQEAGRYRASVFVLRAHMSPPMEQERRSQVSAGAADSIDAGGAERRCGEHRFGRCDLALVDTRDGRITRLVTNVPISWYAASPDGQLVAFAVLSGVVPNTQQNEHDLEVLDLVSGTRRALARGLRMSAGDTVSWSPDGRYLAFVSDGQVADGRLAVFAVNDGSKVLESSGLPSLNTYGFSSAVRQRAPVWGSDSEHVYVLSKEGGLWRAAVSTGSARKVASIPGRRITDLISPAGKLWARGRDWKIWVTTSSHDGTLAGIYEIDLETGRYRKVIERRQIISAAQVDVSDATGQAVLVLSDQQHPRELYLFDPKSGRVRQLTGRDHPVNAYALGASRLIDWSGADGQPMSGTLLLPPHYEPGRRLPLVVWVYGGAMGSRALNDFGLVGVVPVFNFHVLATRGYAVLFPDIPIRVGYPMTDVLRAVMPAVDAAIEQGYADEARLAVLGTSFGSYCVMALITQTTRFKAAEISAVQDPNLISQYLYMEPNGASGYIGFLERGHGKMGGSPWEYPDRYINNSPIFFFDRIETPVLMIHGELDGGPLPHSVFAALRRLGKPVEYRLYYGEGHTIQKKANVIDVWRRRLDFLAQSLDLELDERGAVEFLNGRAKSRRIH